MSSILVTSDGSSYDIDFFVHFMIGEKCKYNETIIDESKEHLEIKWDPKFKFPFIKLYSEGKFSGISIEKVSDIRNMIRCLKLCEKEMKNIEKSHG